MREYKREAVATKDQLKDLTKRSAYHDDHLRIVDAWLSNLMEEVCAVSNVTKTDNDRHPPFESALFSADQPIFGEHLVQKSDHIKTAVSSIFSRIPAVGPDVATLEQKISQLLAKEKGLHIGLQRLEAEKQQLSERLEGASMRYMMAEKKMDRMKSSQVAKLEAQAHATKSESGDGTDSRLKREESKQVNGVVDDDELQNAEAARKEAVAVSEKRLEQLRTLESDAKKLTDELTAVKIKVTKISEDDYANTELFKTFKNQYEDLVKRVNDLEATNIQLRAEIKRLQGERSAYKEETDKEQSDFVQDMESQLARSEADLARIRHARDELLADLGLRKENDKQTRVAQDQLVELAAAKDSRISALEAQLSRLNPGGADSEHVIETSANLEGLDAESLQIKIRGVEREKAILEKELRSMEVALRKTSAVANKKFSEVADAEDRILKATAEKAKADQKYFAAMKAKESMQIELRTQKTQNAKASEIVSQLKDAESSARQLVAAVEKELAEARENLGKLTNQQRELHSKYTAQKALIERFTGQVDEMKKLLTAKDTAVQEANKRTREAEAEAAESKVRVEQISKSLTRERSKAQGSQSEEFEMLRVSRSNRWKAFSGRRETDLLAHVRQLQPATSAEKTSRTPSSEPVATSFAAGASTTASTRASASVRTAASNSARATAFTSLFEDFLLPPFVYDCRI